MNLIKLLLLLVIAMVGIVMNSDSPAIFLSCVPNYTRLPANDRSIS